jgi:hypothetical protein
MGIGMQSIICKLLKILRGDRDRAGDVQPGKLILDGKLRIWRLSCYRTEGGAEVDLVIERGDDILGVEIKAGRSLIYLY